MKKISKTTIAAINLLSPDELEKHSVLEKARYGHICPYPDCQNGAGHDGTGITPITGEENSIVLYHCFKCNRTFNNLQIFKLHYGIDNFAELVERICADFDIRFEYVDFDEPKGKRKKGKRRDDTPIDDVTLGFIKDDLATSTDTLKKYLDAVKTWRGLPLETLLKFNCRLIWQWTSPNVRNSSKYTPYLEPTDRMIIPCSDDAEAEFEKVDEYLNVLIDSSKHKRTAGFLESKVQTNSRLPITTTDLRHSKLIKHSKTPPDMLQ